LWWHSQGYDHTHSSRIYFGFGWKWHQTCLVTLCIAVGFSLFNRIDVIAFSKQVFIGEWRVIQGWGSRLTLFPIEFLLWSCSGWTTCSMGAALTTGRRHDGSSTVGDAQKLKQWTLCTPHLKAALVPGQAHCRRC
jgi:hypothetical protein